MANKKTINSIDEKPKNNDLALYIYLKNAGLISNRLISQFFNIHQLTPSRWKKDDEWDSLLADSNKERDFVYLIENNKYTSNKELVKMLNKVDKLKKEKEKEKENVNRPKKACANAVIGVMNEKSLNIKQQDFCVEMARTGNATRSYMKVYDSKEYNYSSYNARRLLEQDKIIKAIDKIRRKILREYAGTHYHEFLLIKLYELFSNDIGTFLEQDETVDDNGKKTYSTPRVKNLQNLPTNLVSRVKINSNGSIEIGFNDKQTDLARLIYDIQKDIANTSKGNIGTNIVITTDKNINLAPILTLEELRENNNNNIEMKPEEAISDEQ